MTRALYFIAVWCGYFALALAAIAVAQSLNLLDDSLLDLSGQAIMIAERRGTVADVVTAYPPLPLVLSIPFAYLAIPGVFPAALATAFAAAIFATALFRSLRSRRWRAAIPTSRRSVPSASTGIPSRARARRSGRTRRSACRTRSRR